MIYSRWLSGAVKRWWMGDTGGLSWWLVRLELARDGGVNCQIGWMFKVIGEQYESE